MTKRRQNQNLMTPNFRCNIWKRPEICNEVLLRIIISCNWLNCNAMSFRYWFVRKQNHYILQSRTSKRTSSPFVKIRVKFESVMQQIQLIRAVHSSISLRILVAWTLETIQCFMRSHFYNKTRLNNMWTIVAQAESSRNANLVNNLIYLTWLEVFQN